MKIRFRPFSELKTLSLEIQSSQPRVAVLHDSIEGFSSALVKADQRQKFNADDLPRK